MKPEQFIKRYGINEAKKIIDKAPNGTTHIHSVTLQNYMQGEGNNYVWCGSGRDGWYFSIYDTLNGMMALEDLKRLVESVDRVNAFGGLKDAKAVVKMGKHYKYLKAHISNYESIYGGGDE
ncbi:hypothetical protein [Acinetobacter baumannii]|uniref:hypothetical protein n=1 Tax=Acinetobacter baumannii TaxID=470 RepID=UPI0022EDDEA8|nr:hypothetical protein [Acinetobacter baumannii]MCF4281339.1 hypothetical protein [Acinetobacter baumannii]MDA3536760.1 hypothetical protein [Acinetobacter baumannii]